VRIDPRGDIVEVDFELFQDRLTTIRGDVAGVQQMAELPVAPRLRAQVIGNPVTGEGYLLLDLPTNPPPPIALPFTPTRTYVPSMPSVLATVQDRLPEVLERAEETLQTLREIVARVPDSLDRSDRFFTSVERILRESELPELSADLRAFSTSSYAQFVQITSNIAQITSDMDRLVGTEGSLVKFAEEARSAIREADVAATSRATRDAEDRASLAADDLRRSLVALRETLTQMRDLARRLDEQPESLVYGPHQPKQQSR
jgi:hypothetical protein